jgi:hypothetical protein
MVRHHDTLWCDGCGIEITWEPIEQDRLFFCCQPCLEGEKCRCSELDEDYPPGIPSTGDNNISSPK